MRSRSRGRRRTERRFSAIFLSRSPSVQSTSTFLSPAISSRSPISIRENSSVFSRRFFSIRFLFRLSLWPSESIRRRRMSGRGGSGSSRSPWSPTGSSQPTSFFSFSRRCSMKASGRFRKRECGKSFCFFFSSIRFFRASHLLSSQPTAGAMTSDGLSFSIFFPDIFAGTAQDSLTAPAAEQFFTSPRRPEFLRSPRFSTGFQRAGGCSIMPAFRSTTIRFSC